MPPESAHRAAGRAPPGAGDTSPQRAGGFSPAVVTPLDLLHLGAAGFCNLVGAQPRCVDGNAGRVVRAETGPWSREPDLRRLREVSRAPVSHAGRALFSAPLGRFPKWVLRRDETQTGSKR